MISKTITISDAMDKWMKTQVQEGRYGDEGDYIRDLIRRDQDDQKKLASLRSAIAYGRASGVSKLTVSEIITEAQAEIDADL